MDSPIPLPKSLPLPRPFVTANFAITLDGRISTRNRTPSDFSSPTDKRRFAEIRAEADAVLVGATTVAADRMTMGVSRPDLQEKRKAAGKPIHPLRVIVSGSGAVDASLPVFAKDFSPILLFSTTRMSAEQQTALSPLCALHLYDSETVSLAHMLATLHEDHGVKKVVCEGGARLLRSLLEQDLLDEIHLTLCPRVFGGVGAPTLTGMEEGNAAPGAFLTQSTRLTIQSMETSEGECFLRYTVERMT